MSNSLYGFWVRLENAISRRLGTKVFKQEAMLRLAIRELGFKDKKFNIRIDHINGFNYVNGHRFPVIYPSSFFDAADKIREHATKDYKYYFNGNMAAAGERMKMLTPFQQLGGVIVESEVGRSPFSKSKFNTSYYRGLARAEFGLSPHQKNWDGPQETMWTYRFIECCMVGSIPVVFRETPLGEQFVSGFQWVWDDVLLSGSTEYTASAAKENAALVRSRHGLAKHALLEIL